MPNPFEQAVTEPHVSDGGRRKFGGKHGYGHKPSPNAPTPPSFVDHPAASLDTTPSVASLVKGAPPVMDQGQTSSCVGHSTAGAVATSCAASGLPLGFVPSPLDGYTLARAIDRGLGGGSLAAKLVDEGTDPALCAQAYEKFGCREMRSPTSDGRLSDCEPTSINADPNLPDLEKDAQALVVGIHRIHSTGRARVADFRKSIAAGYPVRFAINVDGAFEDYDGRTVLTAPNPADNLGGHALYAIAYRTDENGKTIGQGRNSWGTGWGLNGDFEFDEDFIASMTELDVVSASKVTP